MPHFRLLAGAGILACAAYPSCAHAEPGQSMQSAGSAAAEVVEQVQIQRLANLRFGRFATPSTPSTLRVAMTGAVTPSADLASSLSMAQPPEGRGPAQFRIEMDGNRGFTAYIPASLTISSGSANMLVNAVEGRLVRIVSAGRQSIYRLDMGGTLRVGANQAPGQYSGTFLVTVVYL